MRKLDLWQSDEAFGSSLLIACLDDWGSEFLNWEPETMEITIREKYGKGVRDDNILRLLAAVSVFTSELFYVDLNAFCAACTVLDFERTSVDKFVPAGLDEIMWGLTEARMLLGGIDQRKFSDEVALYTGKLLEEEGIENPPDALKYAKRVMQGTSADTLADLPDLAQMFQEDQELTKEELDRGAMEKLARLLDQINELKLDTSDLSEFKEMLNRMKEGK